MASRSQFVIHNPSDITAVLQRAAVAATESTLRQAAVAGARVFLTEVKVRAMPHYRTGVLEDNLLISYVPEDSVAGKTATYVVTYGKSAWYARLLENGTSKMAAKPFIRPSFEAKKATAGEAVIAVIKGSVK